MILQRLTLYNFRPFFEEQQILFSTDDKQRVTLVHAENGVGKTSLLSAILWCLYGRLVDGVEQPDVLLNHAAEAAGHSEYSVALKFEYEGREYEAVRKGFHDEDSRLQVFEVNDKGHLPIAAPESFINGVVPESMADYFFFHGEGNIGGSGKNIRTAIRDILGFGFAEQAVKDLESIESSLRREINKQSKDPSVIEVNEKLEKTIAELDRLSVLRTDRLALRRRLEEEKKRLDRTLDGVKEIKRLQAERYAAEAKLIQCRRNLDSAYDDEAQFVRSDGWALFSDKILKRGLEFVDESEMKGKFPAPYYQRFIQDLLETGVCICGEALADHSERKAHVRKLLASSGTPSLIDRFSGARAKLNEIELIRGRASREWKRIRSQIRSESEALQSKTEEVARLSELISECDDKSAQDAEARRAEVEEKLFELGSELRSIEHSIADLKERRSTLNAKSKVAASKNKQLQSLQCRFELVETVRLIITKTLDNAESRAVEEIQCRMIALMEKISRKDYTPVLDLENESLHMLSRDGKRVGASTGERLLLNFVFISTLIETCRTRTDDESEILIPGAIAPFVIDAPFGELDDTYKSETAKFLPERARQVILFLSTSHWKGRIEEELEPHIGAEYILVSCRRQPDDGTRQKDLITIRGKEIAQSNYDCETDMTEVVEVDW